jgi:hypothetical protein
MSKVKTGARQVVVSPRRNLQAPTQVEESGAVADPAILQRRLHSGQPAVAAAQLLAHRSEVE